MRLLVWIIWTNVTLIANASLYNLTENRNVCVSILRMTMWLLVRIIWSNADLNLCKFHHQTNEHLVNWDKPTIDQMMGPNIKSNKKINCKKLNATANVSLYNLTKNRNVVGGIVVLTYFLAYFMPSEPQNGGVNVPLYNLTKNRNVFRK